MRDTKLAGCERGDCAEEFAEASILSGLASGEAKPGGAAALCGTVLPACGGVPEAPAGAGGADGRSAAGIDPGKSGGRRESGRFTPEIVEGLRGSSGCGRGRHYLLPRPAGNASGCADVPGDLRGPASGRSRGGTLRIRSASAGDRDDED